MSINFWYQFGLQTNTLQNGRSGHACNSSSSHSIIVFDPKQFQPASIPFIKDEYSEPYEGGFHTWEWFQLTDKEGKKKYLVEMLYRYGFPLYEIASILGLSNGLADLQAWGYTFEQGYYAGGYSRSEFPVSPVTKSIDLDFARDFCDFILRSDVMIRGGNDNEPTPSLEGNIAQLNSRWDWALDYGTEKAVNPPVYEMNFSLTPDLWKYKRALCRKSNGIWTLFDPSSGAKIRLDLNAERPLFNNFSEFKADTPELVDIKITDFCPYGCSFCYQGSTLKGKHAPLRHIFKAIDLCARLGVFEIAFGGGEPTLHPNFGEILQYTHKSGIVPNFTTKSLLWLADNTPKQTDLLKTIEETVGAFAYSVSTVEDIENLELALGASRSRYDFNVNIQVVMGVVGHDDLLGILEACSEYRYRLTLLGFKTTGFGSDYKQDTPLKPYDKWLDVVTQYNDTINAVGIEPDQRKPPVPIQIDTALAKEFETQLRERVPFWSFHTKEGYTSLYIDTVSQTVAPSSYDDRRTTFDPYADIGDLQKFVMELYKGYE